jgi:hypothetical protein
VSEHTEDPPDPQHPAGTGLWLASAVADALVADGFQWSTRARKWDRFRWDQYPDVGRWVRVATDDALAVAADVAAALYAELTDQLDAIRAELDLSAAEHHNRLIGEYRRVLRCRAWLARQESARGLLAALRLARIVGGRVRYIGPPLEVSRRRPRSAAQLASGRAPRSGRRPLRQPASRA